MAEPFTPEQEERIEELIDRAIRKAEHDRHVGIRRVGIRRVGIRRVGIR